MGGAVLCVCRVAEKPRQSQRFSRPPLGGTADDDPPTGTWLSSTHDESYGKQFKIKRIGYWGASGRLTRFDNSLARRDLDVYEFGVYTGVSMRDIAKRVHGFGHLWGFDSFVGLPQETKGEHLEGSHWKPGGFSAADALGEWKLPAYSTSYARRFDTRIQALYQDSIRPASHHSYDTPSPSSRHCSSMWTSTCIVARSNA